MTYLVLKYDMRAPDFGAPRDALYQAAIEQAAWADQLGFGTLMLAEHHGSEDGYLPAPISLASAIAGVTEFMRLRIQALIAPFHDPLRLAEDLAVLDIISGGRAEITAAGGYVPTEFEMFGVAMKERGRRVEESIDTLRQAWIGEPFTFRGRPVRVTPRPLQDPIPIALGGASEAAARRAARMAEAFIPAMPELGDIYRDECNRLGRRPAPPERMGPIFLHIAEDPDRAWEQIAPHALYETNAYGRWMADSMGDRSVYSRMDNAEELRQSGAYTVVTPEECLDIARYLGPGGRLAFHPLMGGMDPDLGWECLELLADKVIPHLKIEEPAPVGRHEPL